jgi:hypothetical protein
MIFGRGLRFLRSTALALWPLALIAHGAKSLPLICWSFFQFDEAHRMPTPKSPLPDLDDEIIPLNIDARK